MCPLSLLFTIQVFHCWRKMRSKLRVAIHHQCLGVILGVQPTVKQAQNKNKAKTKRKEKEYRSFYFNSSLAYLILILLYMWEKHVKMNMELN